MSRTRKDVPRDVRQNRAAKPAAVRDPHLRGAGTRTKHLCGDSPHGRVECDAHLILPRGVRRHCEFRGAPDQGRWDPYFKSAAERSARYWAPERMAVRSSLHRVSRQPLSDIDDSAVVVQQHRRGTWGGGWWD